LATNTRVQTVEHFVLTFRSLTVSQRVPLRSGIVLVLRLRTICYIEPVLAFGTEQDIIVNSHRLSPQRSQRSDLVEFDELHKECLLQKRYCLSEFESEVYQGGLTKF
jgi:hypothetical protein